MRLRLKLRLRLRLLGVRTAKRIAGRAGEAVEKYAGGPCMSGRQILDLLWPLFIDQVYLQGITLINTAMISSYGPEAISAISIIGSFNVFVTNLFVAVATGCAVVVAQYCGRGEPHNASKSAAQAITSTFVITLAVSAALYFMTDAVNELLLGKGAPLTKEYARVFLAGNILSFPLFGITQTVMSALRGAGNTKASIFFSAGINTLNVLLNAVLLYAFNLGVLGLSASVIACRLVFAVLSILYMLYPKNPLYTPPRHYFAVNLPLQRSIMYVAVPTGLEQVFFHGGRIVTQVFIVGFGTMSTAANAVATTYNGLLSVAGSTISAALLTVAGQCVGMGDVEEARKYIFKSTNAGTVACLLTSLISLPLIHPMLAIYNLPPEAYGPAYKASLMVLVGTPITWCFSFVTPSGLRAGGDATFSSVVSLICMWSIRVGLGYLLGVVFRLDLYGIWIAMFTEWAVRGVIFHVRTTGSKWYRHSVIPD